MIVLDASVVVELLTDGLQVDSLRTDFDGPDGPFIAPHLLDVEVANALRGLQARQRIESHRSELFLKRLTIFPVARLAHTPLLPRIWELRHNFTAYDAAYIALAELTGAVLYTMDAKLRTGHRAKIKIFNSNVN